MSAELKAALAALQAEPPIRKEVLVGGRPVPICLRQMSVEMAESVYQPLRDASGKIPPERRAEMVRGMIAATVVNEQGERLFTVDEIVAWPNALFAKVNELTMDVNEVPRADDKPEGEAPND